MNDFEKEAARKYANVSYPAGISGFDVTYSLTPSADPGFSGRNFQYTAVGVNDVTIFNRPCYYCPAVSIPGIPGCAPCGTNADGVVIPCPPGAAYLPDCDFETASTCVPGPTGVNYPACLETCATDCNAECAEYVCNDYECVECYSADCPESTDPDSCFAQKCEQGLGFSSLSSCQASNCEKVVCEAEETQQCFDCKSDYIRSLAGVDGTSYCDDKTLFNVAGFNCRTACNPPVARKDPHLYLPHGGRADFRGANNVTFAMLSAKDVAFNVKFEEADFNWAKRIVHGTKMAAAYWTIRTTTGKMLNIEYNSSSKAGLVHEKGHRDVEVKESMPALVIDNVQVSLENQKLSVVVANKWHMSATVSSFPFGNLAANKNKKLLDIGVEALYDADHDVVAPHGIFGQAYDGDNLGVSGKMDKVKAAESTTEAQAEGSIEGVWSDYKVETPFATAFMYSRFDATAAKPRDVSKLTGEKTQMGEKKVLVGASDVPEVA